MRNAIRAHLAKEQDALRGFVVKRAGTLLQYEELGDLVNGIVLRALDRSKAATYRSDPELRAWLYELASCYLADRHEHWRAAMRGAGRIVRLTLSGLSGNGVPLPRASQPGPATSAARRELLVLSTRAIAALPARDQDLVRWRSEGLSVEEQAERVGLSYAATQRAGLRAFDRFRKLFEIAVRNSRP